MTFRCSKRNMKNSGKPPNKRARLLSSLIAGIFLVFFATFAIGAEQTGKIPALKGPVYTLELDSSINPGSMEFLERAIKQAESGNASCLVVLLDTPGGLVATLRKMIQAVMQSRVPVIVYVYPPGARAASAGALLTLSAHIAAMAPGTNIGAAHPVTIGQKIEPGSKMAEKIENDLSALAVSIAEKRGRNKKWAEEAVRKSRSTTAEKALELHVIDLIAPDLHDLLTKVQGKVVELEKKGMVRIYPEPSNIIPVGENFREKVLGIIADPNIAYVLMMIGMVGLYFELAHPGAIFPGTAGAISLILAFYALQALSASATGVLLVILAFVLFVLELFITSHGLLALSGTISLVLGSLMLFDTDSTGISISPSVLWPTLAAVILFLGTISFLAVKAVLSRPKTGTEGMVGEKGTVRQVLGDSRYLVFIHGELWQAECPDPLHKDQLVQVQEVDGLKLIVKPLED
ncbi:MAG: nodulation protein NfeD [Thermodesulfatator sp.]|nr:MAG: nodulation protein NfeD [Thermodesulfatator sp.]